MADDALFAKLLSIGFEFEHVIELCPRHPLFLTCRKPRNGEEIGIDDMK